MARKKEKYDMMDSISKVKLTKSDYVIRGIGYVLISIFAIASVLPFLVILGTSFETEDNIIEYGVTLFPRSFTTSAYELVIKGGTIWASYGLTTGLTLVGTLCGLFICAMTGYALQRRDFPLRNSISFFIYFTSLFQAGLAPYYLLMTQTYRLNNSYLAVLLPLMVSSWLIILMKNFAKSVPHELTESGKIDGAGDFTIFLAIVLPMLKPALATVGLFLALGYWNEWYQSSLFLQNKPVLPLQYRLYKIVNEAQSLKNSVASQYVDINNLPSESLKMATAMMTTGPIIFLYPFIQRYFIGGITVGAVKG
ncbi:MAG: carbohydrate ABC transporter permease [Christensenellales bacterium]|jgi:putative aldouronate transport system permease protein